MRHRIYIELRKLSGILLVILLAGRLLSSMVPAWQSEEAHFGTTFLLICVIRFVFLLVDLAIGMLRWQRAIFPAIILLSLAAILGSHQSRLLVSITAVIAEVGVLAFVIHIAMVRGKKDGGRIEDRLLERMQLIVPIPLASFLVTELLVIWAAATGLFRRTVGVSGFSYAEKSIFRILPLILLFGSPFDILIIDLMLRAFGVKGVLWTVVLAGTDIYAVLWAYGTLMTMRERPHEVTDQCLRVYKGLFGNATITLNTITALTILPRSRRQKREGSADLSLAGTTRVEIRLNAPAGVIRWHVPDPTPIFTVVISVDDPDDFCRSVASRHDVLRGGAAAPIRILRNDSLATS